MIAHLGCLGRVGWLVGRSRASRARRAAWQAWAVRCAWAAHPLGRRWAADRSPHAGAGRMSVRLGRPCGYRHCWADLPLSALFVLENI